MNTLNDPILNKIFNLETNLILINYFFNNIVSKFFTTIITSFNILFSFRIKIYKITLEFWGKTQTFCLKGIGDLGGLVVRIGDCGSPDPGSSPGPGPFNFKQSNLSYNYIFVNCIFDRC